MSGWTSRARAYAELARVSNLPTCISNVLVGVAVGGVADPSTEPRAMQVTGIVAAIALLYTGGMALNDAVDVQFDRVERPQRPIPSGSISPAAAYAVAVVCLGAGLAILAISGMPAFGLGSILVATIVGYNLTHKKFASSVVLMGACRGLVYLVAAAAVAWPLNWKVTGWLAVSLALYTIGITVVARSETRTEPGARRWLAFGMPVLVLLPAIEIHSGVRWFSLAAGLALAGWLLFAVRNVFSRPPRTIQAVLTWLSGICLVDTFFLTLLGHPVLALVAAGCFVLTAWGHRHILGS